jgi:multiple sugar transport system substrate-binding protein
VRLQAFAGPDEVRAYEKLIGAFERRHPDIDVELTPVGDQGDHVTKLTTDFAAGRPADVFLLNYRRFGQFAGKGQLDPVGPRLAASKAFAEGDLYRQAIDGFVFDGELQCLPQNVSTPVVYYNKRIFAEAGVREPAGDWTWDDLVAAARATRSDDVYGIYFEPSFNRLAPFVWQAGGEVVDDIEDPTRVSLEEPEDLRALRWLIGLRHEHRVFPELAAAESEDPEAAFAQGRSAMLIESRRATTSLRAAEGLDWDVAPLPVDPEVGEPAVMLHSDAYCIARSSKVKDAAWRFAEYAVGPEGAPVLARTGRTVPSLKSVSRSDAFLDRSQRPSRAQVFLDQIPAIRRFPNIAAWNEIESKADPIAEEWFFSTEPPEAIGFEIDVATLEVFAGASGRD